MAATNSTRFTATATVPTLARPWIRRLLLLTCLLTWCSFSYAQFCPDPWASASTMYGTVVLDGSGGGTNGPYQTTTSESASMQVTMPAQIACSWVMSQRGGMGSGSDQTYLLDQLQASDCGGTYTWSGSGLGDNLQINLGITSFVNLYTVQVFDAVAGTFTPTGGCGSGTESLDIAIGPDVPANATNVPLPDTEQLSGVRSYSDLPDDTAQSNIPANWNFAWSLSPDPDDMCEDCTKHMIHDFASDLSLGNQSLGETIGIVGTPFFLRYESARAPGRAGVDAVGMLDAHSLGGWTLNVHHVLQPLIQSFCFGGTCTPYAIVPKAIFLGDGQVRSDDSIQGTLSWNGNFLVASEDGSEIYVFSNHGLHLQTLLSLTGAVLYTFAYDKFNRLVSITDNSGNVTTIQRDVNENPTAIVAPFGQKTLLSVDSQGFLSQITDPAGLATKFTNSVSGLLTSLTDPLGKTTLFQYDSFGRLAAHTDPNGATVALARTNVSNGYSVMETSPMGRTTSHQVIFASTATQNNRNYTNTWENGLQAISSKSLQSGQITEGATLPDGTSFSSTKAPDPRWGMAAAFETTHTDKNGTVTSTVTNARSVTLNDASNPFSLATETDTETTNGRAFTSTFNGSTLSFTNVTPAGRTTTVKLDAKERIISAQVAGFTATTFVYDSHGRVASTTQGTRKTTFVYNSKGFLASITDPMLLKMSFSYDADGRRTTTTLPDGRIIHHSYDADSNLTSVTLPSGAAHRLAYSGLDLPSTYTPPAVTGTGAIKYAYDLDHAVTKVTRPDGNTIAYARDSAGRLTSITTPTSTTTLAYNPTTGNLTSANRGAEGVTYSYNGELLTKSVWSGPITGSVGQVFNNNLWVTSQSINGANTIAYTYDSDGLLTKAGLLTVARNPQNGLVTGTSLGVTTDSRSYNGFGELTGYTASVSGAPVYRVTFTRDADGRITARSETIGGITNSYSYAYDNAGRLTDAVKNLSTDSYSYDSNSNRITASNSGGSVSAAYDAQDRLLNYGTTSFTYTAAGELASQIAGVATTQYQYDVLGNLIAVTLSNGTKISYTVDAENHRVGKSINSVLQTGFLYDDADRIVAQLDGSNALVSQYVYATHEQTPDYMVKGGVTYRIVSDNLGSPILVINTSTGAIAEQIAYDEFGNILADTNPAFQPFGFAGGLFDSDTGLVQFGARDYNPAVGRWTEKDPTLFDGGDINLYAYAVADPVNQTDPTGLGCDKKKIKKIINKAEHKITGDKVKVGPVNVSITKPEMSVGTKAGVKVEGKTVVEVSATATVGVTDTPAPAKSTGDTQFYQDPHPIIYTDIDGNVTVLGHKFNVGHWHNTHWDTSKMGVVDGVRHRLDGFEDKCDGVCRDR
jgi:RHS repeat-associated protein